VTGKFISGCSEDTTEITLRNNRDLNKGESICPPSPGSMHNIKRQTKDAQLVLGKGRDEDWDRHLGVTTLILTTK